ncbi:MAG: PHP domain-containing protein, partial [Cyclobacteriaceae bacterium]|nr:PHP domain-containing protein [Cyclobacteriaceae bacterium]
MRAFFTLLICSIPLFISAQVSDAERKVVFPDIPGYKTLKCDLHIHSVFSDGDVWPTVRVQEANKDGMDAISLTEHLEYQPHRDDIPHPDRNRAHEIAKGAAGKSGLIVIRGSEITRQMPPGHGNAIFITDANKLLVDDAKGAYQAAADQGAFVFWNHPNWTAQRPDAVATLTDLHQELIKSKLLHGIEIANDDTYSDEALQLALDHNLTILGTSDIHNLIDWQFDIPGGGHRPITLVFAKEKTEESIKEALFARRTAVWFKNTLVGAEEFTIPLIKESVKVTAVTYGEKTQVAEVHLTNTSDVEFVL